MIKWILSVLVSMHFLGCAVSNNNSDQQTILIGPETKPCDWGVMKTDCMQVKWTKDQVEWENFGLITGIEGFTYEPGYEYELVIKTENVENPPADGSSKRFILVKEVKKIKK